MPSKDKGVSGSYIERAFKLEDEAASQRRQWMPGWKKAQYYSAKRRLVEAEKQKILSELEMVQESRPLKPRTQKRVEG